MNWYGVMPSAQGFLAIRCERVKKLVDRVHEKLSEIRTKPAFVKSFFKHQSVAYITDS